VILPESLNTSRAGDKFIWRGGTEAPMVQRIGVWVIGLLIIAAGGFSLDYARRGGSFFGRVVSLTMVLLGAKIFRNGFLKRRGKAK
jgi:hypothetical protein